MKIRTVGVHKEIFDPIRKKWVALTPEEQVRQFFIQFLLEDKKIPESHIAVEREIKVNNLSKRFDLVVFANDATPAIVIECKAPNVVLSQKVIEQVARYNKTLRAKYIGITNGGSNYFFRIDFDTEKISYLDDFPDL